MLKRSLLITGVLAAVSFGQSTDLPQIWQVLDADPEILINAQGLAQHDLSIQGAGYSSSGISINGLRLKSPYSAHLNAELPIPGNLLSAPTLGTGMQNISGHLAGTAEFNTQALEPARTVYAGLGTKEHYAGGAYAGSELAGGYIDAEKAREIDHRGNDLERVSGGAVLQMPHEEWTFELITAAQSKEFGAEGYYFNGVAGAADAEQQLDDHLLFAGATRGDLDGAFIRASALYRDMRHQVSEPSSLLFSDVYSRNAAAMVEARTLEIQHIALNLRGDIEYDRVSGDLSGDRTRGSVLILPEARFEHFTIKAGLNSVFQSSESADFLPVAGIDWLVSDNARVFFSYTETEQQPDYQTVAANPALQQQQSKNTELGLKQYVSESCDWQIGSFFRTLENASDWIGGTATDLGRLHISGLDAALRFYPTENLELKAFYQWVYKDNDLENGLYETDYPEHLLNVSAYYRFLEEFSVQFSQTMQLQAANTVRTGDDFGAQASLGLHYEPAYAKNVRLSLLVDNLWGSEFQSVPGLTPRPTTAFAGLAVNW